MKFSYLLVFIEDIDKSLKLYRDILGFEVERRYMEEDGTEAAFIVEKGEVAMRNKAMIELVTIPRGHKPTPSGFLIGVQVHSLDEMTVKMMDNGYAKILGPYSPAPSFFISHFKGPDGEEIGLMQAGS